MKFKIRDTHPDGATNKWYRIASAGGYCQLPVIEGNSSASNKGCNCKNCKGMASNGGNLNHNHIKGSVLQNCKGYATGRFMESQSDPDNGVIVKTNKIPSGQGNGLGWVYDKIQNNHIYDTGSTPRQGALVIWSNSGDGHIAFVEKVYSNTDVLLSESHWSSGMNSSSKTSQNRYGYFGIWRGDPSSRFQGWKFKGYVYAPITWDGEEQSDTPSPAGTTNAPYDRSNSAWVSNNSYLKLSDMKNNALLTYSYLIPLGWSHNAVSALLGNMQQESTINPGLNERGGGGYGLVQWTPKTKYTNWANENGYDIKDGDRQLEWLVEETVSTGQWIRTSTYDISFSDWKSDTTHSVAWLTRAFERNFERSADTEAIILKRIGYAEYWAIWLSSQIIKIPEANIGDPTYQMSDDEYPNLSDVSPSGGKEPGSYHKPDNKHMIITRRRY